MGLVKLSLPVLSIRSQLCELVSAFFLQVDINIRGKDSHKVKMMKFSRTAQGSSQVVHLHGGQARCFIKVQKDGMAFAALVDESYP